MKNLLDERYKFSTKNNFKIMNCKQLESKSKFEIVITQAVMRDMPCAICQDTDFETINEIDRYGFYYPTGVCKNCGHVQQVSYYKKKYLDQFYQNYNQIIYRKDISPEDHFSKSYNKSEIYYKLLKDYNDNINEILDVGCASGGLLSGLGDKFDAETTGIDYQTEFSLFAEMQNLKILYGRIEDVDLEQKFDLITMSHVLEHILKPKETLLKIREHLNPDGIIFIEVPSVDNLLNGAYKYDLLNYFQNMHIHHFTVNNLKNLFSQIGMDILYVDSISRLIAKKSSKSNGKKIVKNYSNTFNLIKRIEAKRNSKIIQFRILLKSLKRRLISHYIHMFHR